MYLFEINNEQHEVKLTLASIKYLNSLHDGGAFEFIQNALTGNLDTYIEVIFAGMFHTERGFTKRDVEAAVDAAIQDEKLDLNTINSTLYGVVSEHFFYKATLQKMFKNDPEAQKAMEDLMK